MQNQQDKSCKTDLAALRQEIDKIDDQIISLFSQRMKIVAMVGEFKRNNREKFFIYSGREADMIKNLVKKAENILPALTVINIWRKLITTANLSEKTLQIAIHNPENIPDYNYLVKDYYSDLVPVKTFSNVAAMITEIKEDNIQIGIFALPQAKLSGVKLLQKDSFSEVSVVKNNFAQNQLHQIWWIALAKNNPGLIIFAKIPFFAFKDTKKNIIKNNQTDLVTVAIKNPEKSIDDNSLLYIECKVQISKTEILSLLEEQNLSAKILQSVISAEKKAFYLTELRGFYLESDNAIKNISRLKEFCVKILGHYAIPVQIDENYTKGSSSKTRIF
jgi:chorismate mutase